VVRSPEDVVDEIATYIDEYGVENINFVDLTAATNRKWTMGLCNAIEARLPGLRWQLPVGTRAESIDREVLQRLHDTGCRNVTFAPESGSARMREVMKKRADAEHILDCVRNGHEIGLRTMCNIVLGHPEERPADVWASTKFLLRAAWTGCDDAAVILFCPYPGSEDFERLVTNGDHELDDAAHYVGLLRSSAAHRSWNPSMGARTLRMLQLGMLAAFYGTSVLRRPRRVLEFIRSQITGQENTYIEQMIRTRRTAIRSRGPLPDSAAGNGAPRQVDPRQVDPRQVAPTQRPEMPQKTQEFQGTQTPQGTQMPQGIEDPQESQPTQPGEGAPTSRTPVASEA
jgi:radical SAM superfamily enzyme YgiQ (UPF0313 family)